MKLKKHNDIGVRGKAGYLTIDKICKSLRIDPEEVVNIIENNPKLPRCSKGGSPEYAKNKEDLDSYKYLLAAIRNIKDGLV